MPCLSSVDRSVSRVKLARNVKVYFTSTCSEAGQPAGQSHLTQKPFAVEEMPSLVEFIYMIKKTEREEEGSVAIALNRFFPHKYIHVFTLSNGHGSIHSAL